LAALPGCSNEACFVQSLRILIADDNKSLRSSLRAFLESRRGWTICGEAEDGREAVEKTLALRPDVILLDITMPNLNGIEAARIISLQAPETAILVVTQHRFRALAEQALRSGARGVIDKSQMAEDLIPAIEAASRHQPVRSSRLAS
jgi:DNA-binding NarL/FixJ family response regulator